MLLLGLLALTACHKDKEFDMKDAVVSDEEMTVSGTQARFSWSVDFAGKFQTGVEVSQNENMAEARRVEATKEEDKFVAIVDSLSMGKKYYYRIVVWNKFGVFGQPVGDFTTTMSYTILVSADEGGSVTGGGTYIAGDTCTVVATANLNYNFVNWTENGSQVSTEAEYSFAVASDRNMVAHFTSQEFTITATAEPEEGGTVDGSGGYNNGDECTLTATANEGYTFINWTKDGTVVSTNPVYTFTVTETATYLANFQVQSYIITVSADQDEGGSVEGGGTYEYGQSCTVHATEANGYHFVNWTENGEQVSSDEEYTFTVTRDRDLVAHFTSQDYIIHVDIDPENSGTVTGNHGYNYDEECTLKAIPAEGFSFVKWTEGNNDILDNPYIFRVTESRNFVAHFQAINYQISVSAEPSGGGTVTGGGNGFHYGDECEVTATAIDGYEFVKWTMEDGTEIFTNPYTFNVTESVSLVAHFQLINYTISISAEPSGGGTVTGGENSFHYGDECILTAIPNDGYKFVNWTKEDETEVSINPIFTFNVTETATYIAHFQLINYTISVSAEPSEGGNVTGCGNGLHYGDECTVTATANNNYNFTNWTENGYVVSTQAEYSFTVTGDRTLVANFLPMGPSGWAEMVSILVLTANGNSPEGATVSFLNHNSQEQQNYPMAPITIDETGYYMWDSFRRGNYQVTISKSGYETIVDEVGIWEDYFSMSYTLNPTANSVFAEYYPDPFDPYSPYVRVYWDGIGSSTYIVYRANCDGSNVTVIAENISGGEYIDASWPELEPGEYKYGVKSATDSQIFWSNCLLK